jgi:hypothetical protein
VRQPQDRIADSVFLLFLAWCVAWLLCACGIEKPPELPTCPDAVTGRLCPRLGTYVTCDILGEPVVGCLLTHWPAEGVPEVAECVAACPAVFPGTVNRI